MSLTTRLVGPNGCGKSTLMTAIGTREVDEINKAMPKNLDVLLVEQEVAASDTISALEVCSLHARVPRSS